MSSLHETAYPRLKSDLSRHELEQFYTPTDSEKTFAAEHVRHSTAWVAFLIELKLFQRLGYFVRVANVPEPIRNHICHSVGKTTLPTQAEYKRYDASGVRKRHISVLRDYFQVVSVNDATKQWLLEVAQQAAETREMLPDIINVLLEELVRHRYELPAFSTLNRLAQTAREAVNEGYYNRITQALTEQSKQLIDQLFRPPTQGPSGWQLLKREPKKPTNRHVRDYLDHVATLSQFAEQLPVPEIPVVKLKYFRQLARALDASEMAEIRPVRRYALAVIFIRAQFSRSLDDAVELALRLISGMENSAQKQLAAYQLEHTQRVDTLIGQLKQILEAYQTDGSNDVRITAIERALTHDIELLKIECDAHLDYAGKNWLPFLSKPYQTVRSILFNCLDILTFRSTSQDKSTEKLINILKTIRQKRQSLLECAELNIRPEKDLRWLSEKWRKAVLIKDKSDPTTNKINRKYLELAIFFHLRDELKNGDLAVEHGERFDDYREQLVDWDTYKKEIDAYCAMLNMQAEPAAFVNELKQKLIALAHKVDEGFAENEFADIEEGRLVLRKIKRKEPPPDLKKLNDEIDARLPSTSITDVLVDTVKWLNLQDLFGPLSGFQTKIDDPLNRFIATLFCYGCNLGPSQAAKSLKGFSRKQVAWLNGKHITEDRLAKAIAVVIDAYNKFELPSYWGSGESVGADGTKWDLYEQNLLSEYHIRYGGYGGIGYYHVSDKYIALFSHFIPCGTHEGVYILNGFHSNDSDIQPNKVHGDTQAQSYPIFALSHLLGIKLMPRIRNIKDLNLFRPEKGVTYKNIDALFDDPINWKLIETHFSDLLRIALSIKMGKITASTILRRLGTKSLKNKLYFAFQELGKVIRTLFLLEYINDVEIRKVVQAATNKNEEFNGFVKWAFFGGEGMIAEDILHEQQKIVKYNHLVANLIILHNVERMTRVLKELQQEGWIITRELLSALAPYRTAHINRFGDYILDSEREVIPIDFLIKILIESSS